MSMALVTKVGIDPGVNNGVAWCVSSKSDFYGKTMDLTQVFTFLAQNHSYKTEVHLEWPQGIDTVWRVRGTNSMRKNARIAKNVGMNHGIAYAIDAFCQAHGIPVIKHSPVTRSKAMTATLARTHGLDHLSQHVADALYLIVDR
jgi:transposase